MTIKIISGGLHCCRDGVADMVRKGKDLERLVLARAVRWVLENRVMVYGNKTVVFED